MFVYVYVQYTYYVYLSGYYTNMSIYVITITGFRKLYYYCVYWCYMNSTWVALYL